MMGMFDVDKIRADFPILRRRINGHPLVYLDNAATSQKPKQVIKALVDYYENHNANVHRGVHTLGDEATEILANTRKKIVGFIGASGEKEIIFVRNATEGVNVLMYAWADKNIGEDDAVVVTQMEHHANLVTWQALCKKKRAQFRVVRVDDLGELVVAGGARWVENGVVMGSLEELLDEKVKLVAMTAVSNVLGVVNDIEAIIKIVRRKAKNAKFLLDGSQYVQHKRLDVSKLGIDFLVFSGHKMLAPMGTGVLWGREKLLETADPFIYGGDMISEVKLEGTRWNSLPNKLEAGTPDVGGVAGLGAAIDYLEKIGFDNIGKHEYQLLEYGMRKLVELEKKGVVEVYGPRSLSHKSAILIFNIKGVHAHDAAQVLDSFGIAVRSGQHCAAPLMERLGVVAAVRASMYFYNTKQEIDCLMEKLPEVGKVFG